MRYYLDQEFNEGFKRGLNLKKFHTIELIQIGVACEDGRTYTAISKDINPKHCNDWVQENVLQNLVRNYLLGFNEDARKKQVKLFDNKTISGQFKVLQGLIGKTNKQIAKEIYDFINPDLSFPVFSYNNSEVGNPDSSLHKHFNKHNVSAVNEYYVAHPTFSGYYCDYDHVLFCSLYGNMSQLPPGYPMFMVDLKQKLDETIKKHFGIKVVTTDDVTKFTQLPGYPINKNEHDALADAKWNKQLDDFLNSFS